MGLAVWSQCPRVRTLSLVHAQATGPTGCPRATEKTWRVSGVVISKGFVGSVGQFANLKEGTGELHPQAYPKAPSHPGILESGKENTDLPTFRGSWEDDNELIWKGFTLSK